MCEHLYCDYQSSLKLQNANSQPQKRLPSPLSFYNPHSSLHSIYIPRWITDSIPWRSLKKKIVSEIYWKEKLTSSLLHRSLFNIILLKYPKRFKVTHKCLKIWKLFSSCVFFPLWRREGKSTLSLLLVIFCLVSTFPFCQNNNVHYVFTWEAPECIPLQEA